MTQADFVDPTGAVSVRDQLDQANLADPPPLHCGETRGHGPELCQRVFEVGPSAVWRWLRSLIR